MKITENNLRKKIQRMIIESLSVPTVSPAEKEKLIQYLMSGKAINVNSAISLAEAYGVIERLPDKMFDEEDGTAIAVSIEKSFHRELVSEMERRIKEKFDSGEHAYPGSGDVGTEIMDDYGDIQSPERDGFINCWILVEE